MEHAFNFKLAHAIVRLNGQLKCISESRLVLWCLVYWQCTEKILKVLQNPLYSSSVTLKRSFTLNCDSLCCSWDRSRACVEAWKAQERKYLLSLFKIDGNNSNAITVSWTVSVMSRLESLGMLHSFLCIFQLLSSCSSYSGVNVVNSSSLSQFWGDVLQTLCWGAGASQ